jgi:hypothetical protein
MAVEEMSLSRQYMKEGGESHGITATLAGLEDHDAWEEGGYLNGSWVLINDAP